MESVLYQWLPYELQKINIVTNDNRALILQL
jgi:hypothetical protein